MPETKPDIPRVAALELEDGGCLVACGKRYCIIAGSGTADEGTMEVRVEGELQSGIILHAACHGDEFCLITSVKTLQRRKLCDGSLFQEYLLDLQLATVEYLPSWSEQHATEHTSGICLADKFGDVNLTTWKAVSEKSVETARSIYRHFKMFPKDLPFAEKFAWIEKYIANQQVCVSDIDEEAAKQEEPLEAENPLQTPEALNKFDSGKPLDQLLREYDVEMGPSFMGHLASITFMRLVQWKDTMLCLTGDRDEKVRVSYLPELWEIQAVLCGHSEFIVDAVLVNCGGKPYIVSTAGDCTMRSWSLTVKCSSEATVPLPSMPVSLTVLPSTDGSTTVSCITVGSKAVHRYRVLQNGDLTPLPAEELATAPLAMSKSGRFWVGDDGRIWRRCATASWDRVGHIDPACAWIHLWKHDREEGAMSQEERLAKRLRHADADAAAA